MKIKINYRLKKYPQTFFNFNNYKTTDYKRYKHRLIAWYLLHEYSLHFALVHLAKYTNMLYVINHEFLEYKNEIEKLYQIDLSGKHKYYFKNILIKGDKLCCICGKRILTNSIYCSQSCANKGKDNSKISDSLKKYYTNIDKSELSKRHKKIQKTLIINYTSMTEDEIKIQCTNKYTKTHNYRTYTDPIKIKKYLEQKFNNKLIFFKDYTGANSKLVCECKKHNVGFKIKYSRLKNMKNSEIVCPECFNKQKEDSLLPIVQKTIHEVNKNKKQKITFVQFMLKNKIMLNCKKHGNYITTLKNLLSFKTGCPVYPTYSSKAELEIKKLIPYAEKNKTLINMELDIYSKDKNFAIEYNGIMWHSFGKNKSKKFNNFLDEKIQKYNHLKKTELCEEKGVQLYHIFENEWLNPIKQQIWISMITSKLGQSKRIYARKCTIKEIDSIETRDFLNKNHIQGPINARIRLGLFYKSELVQVMTFRTPTQNKYKGEHNYELSRLCSKIGFNIIGGASKLLKYFERNYNPKFIISYANRRWSMKSECNVYNKLGFDFSHSTEPNYFYFKGSQLETRNKFQKHKLKYILSNFNPNLSETENMYNNNYRKIYDCGNLVYIKLLNL